jgi:hypothetical protein
VVLNQLQRLNELPDALKRVAQEAFVAMCSHPQHHLAPYYRQKIYIVLKTFNKRNDVPAPRTPSPENLGDRVQGWLAIQTAERVLPIFEQGSFRLDDIPEDVPELPTMLIAMAKGVMRGTLTSKGAERGMHAADTFPHMLQESEYDLEGFPVNAILAGSTSASALSEVLGWYRFDLMGDYYENRWLQPPEGAEHAGYEAHYAEDEDEGPIRAESDVPTDDRLVRTGGDAAAEAAVAYACGPLSTRCEPERLEEFWTWWLTEALPKAWEMARDGA